MNPALAVMQTLQDNAETLWVGGEGGMEARLVERAHVPFKTIPAAGVHGVGLKALPGNLFRLALGFFAARRILAEFKPDVLFFTGGFFRDATGSTKDIDYGYLMLQFDISKSKPKLKAVKG